LKKAGFWCARHFSQRSYSCDWLDACTAPYVSMHPCTKYQDIASLQLYRSCQNKGGRKEHF
jgi:hypothetical protein